tara:strand:+ start:314 stop:439 length:126 start_codon:yes stop_codon:yes gene_type:complete
LKENSLEVIEDSPNEKVKMDKNKCPIFSNDPENIFTQKLIF